MIIDNFDKNHEISKKHCKYVHSPTFTTKNQCFLMISQNVQVDNVWSVTVAGQTSALFKNHAFSLKIGVYDTV